MTEPSHLKKNLPCILSRKKVFLLKSDSLELLKRTIQNLLSKLFDKKTYFSKLKESPGCLKSPSLVFRAVEDFVIGCSNSLPKDFYFEILSKERGEIFISYYLYVRNENEKKQNCAFLQYCLRSFYNFIDWRFKPEMSFVLSKKKVTFFMYVKAVNHDQQGENWTVNQSLRKGMKLWEKLNALREAWLGGFFLTVHVKKNDRPKKTWLFFHLLANPKAIDALYIEHLYINI